jgi:hypothetical protein
MLAEYAVLSEEALVTVPNHLSFEEAATLPCAAVTAWVALTGHRRVTAGDTEHARDRRLRRRRLSQVHAMKAPGRPFARPSRQPSPLLATTQPVADLCALKIAV